MRFRSCRELAVFAVLCGCSSAQPVGNANSAVTGSQSTAALQAVRSFPHGIVVSDQEKTSRAPIGGLYPGVGDPDPSCCWLASRARVTVNRSGNERTLLVTIYVASVDYLAKHPQAVTLSVDAHSRRYVGLTPGVHKLTFPLDESVKSGPFELDISGNTFIPSKTVPANQDARQLSVILNQVAVQ